MTKIYTIKPDKPIYGIATRNPPVYEEVKYLVCFFTTEKQRDKKAQHLREFMPEVVTFELAWHDIPGLT